MLQTHVNNDIYNKYCLIHNNINFNTFNSEDSVQIPSASSDLSQHVLKIKFQRTLPKRFETTGF